MCFPQIIYNYWYLYVCSKRFMYLLPCLLNQSDTEWDELVHSHIAWYHYFIFTIYMLLERVYITKLYIERLETGKHFLMKIQVNADNSLYWNKCIFMILMNRNITFCFLISFCIFIIQADRQTDRQVNRLTLYWVY